MGDESWSGPCQRIAKVRPQIGMDPSFCSFDTKLARNYDQTNFPLRSSFFQSEFFP